jgi:hypothetical protein
MPPQNHTTPMPECLGGLYHPANRRVHAITPGLAPGDRGDGHDGHKEGANIEPSRLAVWRPLPRHYSEECSLSINSSCSLFFREPTASPSWAFSSSISSFQRLLAVSKATCMAVFVGSRAAAGGC